MRTRGRFATVALVASIAVWSAGCTSTPLSVSQLRTQAGQICQRASAQASGIPIPSSPQAGAPFLQRGVSVETRELAGLRSLTPPAEIADEYSRAVGALSQQLDELRSASRTFTTSGDPVITLRSLQRRLTPLQNRENSAWRSLDIPACVNA